MKRICSLIFQGWILATVFVPACSLIFSPFVIQAQDRTEDTIRVKTREVIIDTLVKDKKTGTTVKDLTRDDFEVLADGKPRTISYFNREGDTRQRPLALMIIFNLVSTDVGKYLRRTETLKSLDAALKNLSPEDEVTILARVGGDAGNTMRTLTEFTRDHNKMSAALATILNLRDESKPDYYINHLNGMLEKINFAVQERPNSQIVVVSLETDVAPIRVADRDEFTAKLVRTNVAYNPLIVEIDKKYLVLRPLREASGRLAGVDVYGVARYIAGQTGGNPVNLHGAKDLGAALENMLNSLEARYVLGFTLDENEQTDGRMHKLDVKVKARKVNGKEQNLIVQARRGYYIPSAE